MQNLETVIKSAILNLRTGDLDLEEDVKLAVILPILIALDWDPADRGSLRPEYPVGLGRVDYALLCHGRPQVFVEAKRRGALDARAEAQLFGYATNNGVPLLVLSDGLQWDFYLSMAAGLPEERRFGRLDLRDENRVHEYVKMLDEWLRKQHVASGDARRSAESRLENDHLRARARESIPQAWRSLVGEPDGLLCELLEEEVKSQIGVAPQRHDVEEFLRRLSTYKLPSVPVERSPIVDESQGRTAHMVISPSRCDGGRRQGTPVGISSASATDAAQSSEKLQDIVQDLMYALLEDFPGTLDGEMIDRLQTNENPLGLKIRSYALLRKVSDGRLIRGRSRYWKHPFAGRWYVCSEWWKKDHRHNARALSAWVELLVSGVSVPAARGRLRGIADRLSIHSA